MTTHIEEIFKGAKAYQVPRGKVIVYEGHSIKRIYYITSGYVKVYIIAGAFIQRTPYVYKAGEVFPLTTFLSGERVARFFYEAMTPLEVLYLTPKQLENKIKGNLALAEELIRYTTATDEQFIQRVNEMISVSKPLNKIVRLLIFLAKKENSRKQSVQLDMTLSAKEVANMCGISREEAQKHLRYLKSTGAITNSGNLIIHKQKLQSLKI